MATGIGHSERVRPAHLRRKAGEAEAPEFSARRERRSAAPSREGLAPERIAERVVRAIREDRFYVLPEEDPWLERLPHAPRGHPPGRNPTLAVPGR